MYTTSGLKQSGHTMYMERYNIHSHESTPIEVRLELSDGMQKIKLEHVWELNASMDAYIATPCGVFGCACCDIDNLEARKQRFITR